MELTWTQRKPTEPGAYWVRGYRMGREFDRALVSVEKHNGELWSNLHQSTSEQFDDDFSGWSAIADHGEKFEWCGPLVPPNA